MRKIVIVFVVLAAVASCAAAQTYKTEAVRSLVLAGGGTDPTKTLTLKVPAMPLGSITLTLPNQNGTGLLINDGTGSLSWFTLGGLLTNPMTGAGDMIYGGLLGLPSRLAATATANQILLSGANAAPSWSMATYPATSGSAGNYVRSNGTNFVSSSIQAADVPTLNQNTTGTSANVTSIVALANGGSGVTNASGVAQNAVFAGPSSGGAGAASWRTLTTTDIPSLSATYLPLAGGTMSGDITIGAHNVTGTTGAFTSGSLVLTGTSHNGTITVPAGLAQATAYTIPDPGAASATIALTTSNITGSAAKLTTARTIAGNSFDGSANITFSNKFIVQGTSDAGLSGAQFLGSLATGLVKNTTATGVLSIAAAGTDYSSGTSALATGILKSTTGTGALSIAVAGDFPTFNQNTTGTASNVTGVVALANGGTGVTNASGVAQNAVFAGPSSGGAGTASFRVLAAADVPSGSSYYIQNGTGQQTSASFNVDGSGAVGTTFTAGTSVTSPILYGGSAAGSALNLASTSSGSPSGDYVKVTTGGSERARFNNAGQLGLATNAPNTALDVNGDFATRATTNTTTTTTLNNLSTSGTSNLFLSSETADFTITGFANGYDGKQLHVYNKTTHNMTISNESANSSAGNRINTLAGADLTLLNTGAAEFVYDATANEWVSATNQAGGVVGGVASGIGYGAVLSTSETGTGSTVTDTHLIFSAVSAGVYEVQGVLLITTGSTTNSPTISIGFTAGASSSISIPFQVEHTASGNTGFDGVAICAAEGTTYSTGIAKNTSYFVPFSGLVVAGATGTAALKWILPSDGSLLTNSYLRAIRLK